MGDDLWFWMDDRITVLPMEDERNYSIYLIDKWLCPVPAAMCTLLWATWALGSGGIGQDTDKECCVIYVQDYYFKYPQAEQGSTPVISAV